jgi:hypothetical protein
MRKLYKLLTATLGFPLYNAFLPYIQQTRGAEFGDGSTYLTYRNSLIIAVLGVPGCLLGGLLVETPRVGRKGTLSASTILTGVFLFGSTTALKSDALLGWNCAYNFMSNIMYAVLYVPRFNFPYAQRKSELVYANSDVDTHTRPKSSAPKTVAQATPSPPQRTASSASWRPSSPCLPT